MLRTLAGAVVGAAVAVMFAAAADPDADVVAGIDKAMGDLSAGLAL